MAFLFVGAWIGIGLAFAKADKIEWSKGAITGQAPYQWERLFICLLLWPLLLAAVLLDLLAQAL
ncbi:MAG: hypothetical protein ACO3X1_16700 [Burkholderiaceae bacterium]